MDTDTDMDMGSMRTESLMKCLFKTTLLYITLISLLFYQLSAFAKSLIVVPTIAVQETYSDNINLSPTGNKKGAFVTSVSPGVSITANTPKNTLNLNYRMQNLYNAGGNGGLNIFNQLQFNSHSVLLNNKFFLDARSGISQQNLNNTRIVADNLSGASNRTNVSTFGLSPYWRSNFGNYASGLLRVNFDTIKTDANSQNVLSNSQTNLFSDSVNVAEIVQLNSGPEFKRVNWSVGFNNNENYRSGGNDVKFQNLNAIVRTYINHYFNVFAAAGYSNNSYATNLNNVNNGINYTFGGRWTPSQHYFIEAGYGNNAYVTVFISPIQRFNWTTTYRDNSKGLNSGKTWQTSLNYNTRNSNWSITRINDTTTVQTILSQLQVFPDQNSSNSVPNTNDPNQFVINTPTYTDDVIVRTTWNFSTSYTTGKSTFRVSLFDQDRVFQLSNKNERVTGVNGLWNWQFAHKTNAYLTPLWQETKRGDSAKDTRYSVAVGINRQITNFINSRLEVSHVSQNSDLVTNNYEENRATASLFMRF